MKTFVTICIVICFLLVDTINTEIPKDIYENYNKSYKQWQDVKKLWKNSYQYTFGKSSWTGYRTSTTISVLNGEVVQREYKAFDRSQQRAHWVENKDQLYSHAKSWGEVQPGTFDNIYSSCLESLNISSPNENQKYELTFRVDAANHGLLKSCGYYPIGCMDDCFFGVSIENLKSFQKHQLSNTTGSITSTTKNIIGGGKIKKINKNIKFKKPNKDKIVKKINNNEEIKKD